MLLLSVLAVLALLVLGMERQLLTSLNWWRRPRVLCADQQELGRRSEKAFRDRVEHHRRSAQLVTSGPTHDRLSDIFKRVLAEAHALRPESRSWPWQWALIDDGKVNASAYAGGLVLIHSGLWRSAKLSEDQLAIVVGHEVAHAICEHSREALTHRDIAAQLLGTMPWVGALHEAARHRMEDLVHRLPLSRACELEADAIGIELAHRAGFDAGAAASLWKLLSDRSGLEPDSEDYLSTHPCATSREINARRVLSDL